MHKESGMYFPIWNFVKLTNTQNLHSLNSSWLIVISCKSIIIYYYYLLFVHLANFLKNNRCVHYPIKGLYFMQIHNCFVHLANNLKNNRCVSLLTHTMATVPHRYAHTKHCIQEHNNTNTNLDQQHHAEDADGLALDHKQPQHITS
jgi:hypothetical protein